MTNIGKFSEFESGVAKKVKVDGVAVAVVRIDDEIFAIADKCSHADVSLSESNSNASSTEVHSTWSRVFPIPCQPHSQSLCMKCP